jgi:uracil-DNA glycosylase
MRSVIIQPSFESWRDAARDLLIRSVPPDEILWSDDEGKELLFAIDITPTAVGNALKVPAAFVEMAQSVACHRDPTRWGLLYRILWRVTRCGDMAKARLLEKSVRREIHKMHAFVRFRLIDTDPTTGRERYAAWFEPDHFIVQAGTPFFKKRFANMDWSIFTPKGCAHWNGKHLTFTAGLAENPIDSPDALEAAWLTYYRSIFNPARLKVKMMQTEMPKRYWKNLPEAELIDELIEGSKHRVNNMLAEEPRPVKPRPKNAYLDKLRDMSEKETP